MNGPFTKDHKPNSKECEMYVNGSIDDLSVVAEQCCSWEIMSSQRRTYHVTNPDR